MRFLKIAFALLALGISGAALADYAITPGAGSTVLAFVCQTTKICPAHVLIDSTGTEKGTTTNPVSITETDPVDQFPGVSAPLARGIQGVSGGVPIADLDAGNIAIGNGSGTCASACNGTALWTLDTSGFSAVTIQTTSAGTGATITFQGSNDNATWVTIVCSTSPTSAPTNSQYVTTNAVVATVSCPATMRYMRGEFTAYTSGTRTDFWVARKAANSQTQTVTIGGTATIPQYINPYSASSGPGTPISGNATGSTGAVVGTLAGTSGKTTYICGFNVSAIGGTAAIGPVTVAGLIGASQVYQLTSTAAGLQLAQSFFPCHPASAQNTAITITTTADGTATAVDVNSWGFQQ